MPDVTNGTGGLIAQPNQAGWTPSRGPYVRRSWKGLKDAVDVLASDLRLARVEYEISQSSGPTAIITAIYNTEQDGTQAEAASIWEIVYSTVEKDILSIPESDGVTEDGKRRIKDALEKNELIDVSAGDDGVDAREFYQLMLSGVKNKPIFQPVLKQTLTVSNSYGTKESNSTYGKVFKTSTVEALIDEPVLFTLPTDADPADDPLKPTMKYGWLRKPSEIQQVAFQKWHFIRTWEYGLYATLIYGEPT